MKALGVGDRTRFVRDDVGDLDLPPAFLRENLPKLPNVSEKWVEKKSHVYLIPLTTFYLIF